MLNISTNLRAVTCSKVISPTHFYHVTPSLNPSPRVGTYSRPRGLYKRCFALAKLELNKMRIYEKAVAIKIAESYFSQFIYGFFVNAAL